MLYVILFMLNFLHDSFTIKVEVENTQGIAARPAFLMSSRWPTWKSQLQKQGQRHVMGTLNDKGCSSRTILEGPLLHTLF